MCLSNIQQREITNFINKLISWYEDNKRDYPWRKSKVTNYQKITVEILLQRTKADTVSKIYKEFFKKFPNWQSISSADINKIEESLKPIGLWKRRADVLKRLSKEMTKKNGRFPVTREQIDKLPGAGQYVANAVELFVHGKPRPLIDVNMARVLERYFGERKLADIRYDAYLQTLAQKVVESTKDHITINWAILDFAALVCKSKNPICVSCILRNGCKYYK